jgi:hypothetical protein
MFLKAEDPCAAVKGAEGAWSVFGGKARPSTKELSISIAPGDDGSCWV